MELVVAHLVTKLLKILLAKGHYHVYYSLLKDRVLCQTNPIHTLFLINFRKLSQVVPSLPGI